MGEAAFGSARCPAAEWAPHDPDLDGRCFPCSARGQGVERFAGLDEGRRVACRGLVSAHDHIDVERIKLDASADPSGLIRGDVRRARTKNGSITMSPDW